ncbi:MAG: hypothetical protein ACTSRS_10650 [Candidatus Helarchaeota archaeon]
MYEDRNDQYRPEPQHLLQHEFSVIVFLDYLTERPFDLIHQPKVIHQYKNQILAELVSTRNEIRESWIDNRIDDGISQIIATANQVAIENGFGQSLRKQSMKYTLPLLIGIFALSFAIIFFGGSWFPEEMYWVTWVIYFIPLLVICFVPRLINQRLLERWLVFAQQYAPIVKKQSTGVIERFRNFIQNLIDDVRQILSMNKLDFANYQLILFNPDYKNIKVLAEDSRKGVRFYRVEFLPLEETDELEDNKLEDDYEEFENPES